MYAWRYKLKNNKFRYTKKNEKARKHTWWWTTVWFNVGRPWRKLERYLWI